MTNTMQRPWFVDWCVQAHGSQMYGDKPYLYHLAGVAALAISFGFTDLWLQMLLYAHDVVEDRINPKTGLKYTREDLIEAGFPPLVADAILAITDQPGADRHEIKAKTLPIIAAFIVTPSENGFSVRRPVVLAKLFDRGFNLQQGRPTKNAKYVRYQEEHPDFVKDLYDPAETEFQAVWDWVNSLAAD